MRDASVWLPPLIVTTAVALLGWLLRQTFGTLKETIERLETTFTRVTGELAAAHQALEARLDRMDRRVTRLESWRDMLSLPFGTRRHTDRLEATQQREDEED